MVESDNATPSITEAVAIASLRMSQMPSIFGAVFRPRLSVFQNQRLAAKWRKRQIAWELHIGRWEVSRRAFPGEFTSDLAGLESRKLRLALFAHCGCALAHVRAEESEHLHCQRSVKRGPCRPKPVVQRSFRESYRLLWSAGELARHFHRPDHQLLGRDTQTHQPDAFRLAPVDEIGGHQVVLRFRHPAQERPDDHRVVARSDPEPQVTIGYAHRLGGDADIG